MILYYVILSINFMKRVGAEVACWAHNPKVGGSKPSPANTFVEKISD